MSSCSAFRAGHLKAVRGLRPGAAAVEVDLPTAVPARCQRTEARALRLSKVAIDHLFVGLNRPLKCAIRSSLSHHNNRPGLKPSTRVLIKSAITQLKLAGLVLPLHLPLTPH